MKQLSSLYIILLVALAGGAGSCNKFLEVDDPTDQLTTDFVYSDSATAEATLIGLYANISRVTDLPLNGFNTLLPSLSADELYRSVANATYDEFTTNSITINNSTNNNNWNVLYTQLYHANSILDNLQRSTNLSSDFREQLKGEALFLRALHYFYLVNYYGPLPLALTGDYRVNATLSRSDTATVYQQLITDLKEAAAVLGPSSRGGKNVRANKWAAKALLARVYLYAKDWENAAKEATDLITESGYSEATLANAFLVNSPETIFQLIMPLTSTYNTSEGITFIPSSATAIPNYVVRPELLASFEAGDNRKTSWLGSNTVKVNGEDKIFYYPYKYKIRSATAGAAKTEGNVLLRLSEQYLIRAEALARLNRLDEAIADLDEIRLRAGLDPIADIDPTIGQQELLDTIYHEQRIEFFAEGGHRWFNLKRTGLAPAVLAPLKGSTWASTDVLYPIPNDELMVNHRLEQNDGYPK